ncbi:hypothetical protein QOT17_011450 [Balamuthia mandrillaris]
MRATLAPTYDSRCKYASWRTQAAAVSPLMGQLSRPFSRLEGRPLVLCACLFLLAFILSSTAGQTTSSEPMCPYQEEQFTHRPFPLLSMCEWYREEACCDTVEANQLLRWNYVMQKWFRGDSECLEKLTVLLCGLLCSPRQSHFVFSSQQPGFGRFPDEDAFLLLEKDDDAPPMDYENEQEEEGLLEEIFPIAADIGHRGRLTKGSDDPIFVYNVCSSFCETLFDSCFDSVLMSSVGTTKRWMQYQWTNAKEFCEAQAMSFTRGDVTINVIPDSDDTISHAHRCYSGRKREASAARSFIYGEDLDGGFVGPSSFSIQAVDAFGDVILDSHDHFDVRVDGLVPVVGTSPAPFLFPSQSPPKSPSRKVLRVPVDVADLQNGIYVARYDITRAMDYRISVKLDGKPVSNSPIIVRYDHRTMCPLSDSLLAPTKATQPLPFCQVYSDSTCCDMKDTIRLSRWWDNSLARSFARGTTDNRCGKLYDSMLCGLGCSPRQSVYVLPAVADSWEYRVCESFCMELFKACKDEVVMGLPLKSVYARAEDFCVASSPQANIEVKVVRQNPCFGGSHHVVSPRHSYAFGAGVELTGTAGQELTLYIQAVDSSGRDITSGGDLFDVRFIGPYVNHGPLEDDRDGTYYMIYEASRAATYEIHISYQQQHIWGSPYVITLKPGKTDPLTSSAHGPGTARAIAGLGAFFTVEARDSFHNQRHIGGDEVVALLNGPDNVLANVEDNNDGTYLVRYSITKAGQYVLRVTLNGFPLPSSPFLVTADSEGIKVNLPGSLCSFLRAALKPCFWNKRSTACSQLHCGRKSPHRAATGPREPVHHSNEGLLWQPIRKWRPPVLCRAGQPR